MKKIIVLDGKYSVADKWNLVASVKSPTLVSQLVRKLSLLVTRPSQLVTRFS